MEASKQERQGRGVWEPTYRSPGGHRWLHAIATDGRLLAWCEFGPDTEHTLDEANAKLWRTLKRRDPVPELRLIRGDGPPTVFKDVSDTAAGRVIALTLGRPH